MNLSHTLNLAFVSGRTASGMSARVAQKYPQIHSPVEAVGERAEVLAGVLAELESLLGLIMVLRSPRTVLTQVKCGSSRGKRLPTTM